MLTWLVLACSGGGDADTAAPPVEADPIVPSEYVYEPPVEATTLLDPSAVEAALAQVIPSIRSFEASPVLAAYDQVMADADPLCPEYYENEGNTFWYDYCYADSGALYSGYGFYYAYEAYPDGAITWDGGQLTGLATVTTSSGFTFDAGGTALDVVGHGEDSGLEYTVYYTAALGSFHWDGPEADGTWMDGGADPDLVLYAAEYPSMDARYLSVDGGIAGLDGDVLALVFDEIIVANIEAGRGCEIEPSGAISVRDAAGNWYDVAFQGDMAVRYGECDGCGALAYQGQELGPVCVDVASWIDWEGGVPW